MYHAKFLLNFQTKYWQNLSENTFPIFLFTTSPKQSSTGFFCPLHEQSEVRSNYRPNADESL